jgi:transcriptional regulator with XRE-family HTH domain
MRPRWSQQFLADELTLRGFPATRGQIARLENCDMNMYDANLLAAVACLMGVADELVRRAIVDDYGHAYAAVEEDLRVRT